MVAAAEAEDAPIMLQSYFGGSILRRVRCVPEIVANLGGTDHGSKRIRGEDPLKVEIIGSCVGLWRPVTSPSVRVDRR